MSGPGELKQGDYLKYKDRILKVVKKELVTCGTHSHNKVKLFVEPLEGGGTKILTFAHSENINKLDILKKQASVVSKTPDEYQIMDAKTYEMMSVPVDSVNIKLNQGDNVIFVDVEKNIMILEKK